MRVLGIAPSSTDLKWALLDGSANSPSLLDLPSIKQKLPSDDSEGHALLGLRQLLTTFFKEQQIQRVCVLQAGTTKFRGPSPARLKAEGIVQLVGAELNIEVRLAAPQTLRAREKKFAEITGGEPEAIFNGNQPFKPKDWRDAVLVGWWGLE
jgi:hypothetical protein